MKDKIVRDHHGVERNELFHRVQGASAAPMTASEFASPPSKEESDRRKRAGEVMFYDAVRGQYA